MKKIKFRPGKPETHESFIWDEIEGELVYDSERLSTLERRDTEMVFTIRAAKTTNWLTMAELVADECCKLSNWAFDEQRRRHFDFEQLCRMYDWGSAIEDLMELCPNEDDEDCEYDGEEPVFMLTHIDHWWEMYEGDDEYLFRYRLPKCEMYPMMCRNDMDALEYLILDEMHQMTSFLRGWYEKVNGYAYDNDKNKN